MAARYRVYPADFAPLTENGCQVVVESPLERHVALALAERFRRLRDAAGLTQEDVANLAGMNRNHYQLLESGYSDRKKATPANPRLSTLVALCEVFKTSLPELVADIVP